MTNHPLEGLLRPPLEIYVAVAGVASALIAAQLPWQSPTVIGFDVLFFGTAAGWATYRAWRLLRYQSGLRVITPYTLDEALIPLDTEQRFIGQGFEWTALHTQRLSDALSLPGLAYLKAKPWEPTVAGYGKPCIHGVGGGEAPFWIAQGARAGHCIVYGVTGAGKTTLERLLVVQDAATDHSVIVFDPKSDPRLKQTAEAAAASFNKPFYVFDLGDPEHSCCYNPLADYGRITELPGRLTASLPNEGDAGSFAEYAWLFSNVAAQGLIAMDSEVTLEAIRHYLHKPDDLLVALWDHFIGATKRPPKPPPLETRGWSEQGTRIAKRLETERSEHAILHLVADLLRFSAEYYSKISNALLPHLDKLITGPTGELFLPSDTKTTLSWQQALAEKAIVYVCLSSLADPVVGKAAARMMFSDLASLAGRQIHQPTPAKAFIHADELGDLLGESFIPMMNKTRESFVITAYTQVAADIVTELGPAGAARVTGNFNNLILLRVADADTAHALIEKLPEAEIITATSVNLALDSADPASGIDYTSRAGDDLRKERVPMVSPSTLMSLPNGHGFALIKGGLPVKFRFPWLT